MALHQSAHSARIVPTVNSGPVSLQRLRDRKTPVGAIFCAPAPNRTTELLGQRDIPVVLDRGLLVPHLRQCGFDVAVVDSIYHTALPVEAPAETQALLDDVEKLLDRAKGKARKVALGDLDYPRSPVAGRLFARQEEAFGLTWIGEEDQPGLFGGARHVVLSCKHPLVQACVALAASTRPLAAQLLAQAIAVTERRDRGRIAKLAATALDWQRKAAKEAAESASTEGAE
jgi:hypothetical protein